MIKLRKIFFKIKFMSEGYNKDWYKELKSFDVGGDDKNNKKQDKIRNEAIRMINDFKIRNLPPEQFNRLVDGIEDILFRKDIDEEKLKTEFKNVLNHEKNLVDYYKKLAPLKSTLDDINKAIKTKGVSDKLFDKATGGEIDKSLRESLKITRSSIGEIYTEIKDIIFYDSSLTEKQKKAYEELISNYINLLRMNSDDPTIFQMLNNQINNTGVQVNTVKKTIETKLNPNQELFKIAISTGINSNKAIEDIFNNGKQIEFENYLISNNSQRKVFLDKFSKVRIGAMCPSINGSIFYDFLGKLHLFEFNKKRKVFEQELVKKLGKENGKKLLNLIDEESKISACTFDLVKVISDFNKTLDGTKTNKLSLNEIKYFTGESINLKNDEHYIELNKILNENDVLLNELEGKNEKEIRRILGFKKINIEAQDKIIGLYLKYKDSNIITKRFNTLTTADIGQIIEGKNKGLSNKEINSGLEKGNPALKTINQNNNISSNINFSSSVINIPSDNRREFYNELYKNLDSGKDGDIKTLSSNDGFNFNISKTGNKYRVNYGDRTEICERKEVRNVIEMGKYMKKIGLGFLFGGISRVIEKINSKPTGIKINELDGLDNSEKILGLKSIGEALIPGFDSSNTDIKELERQFTDKDIFNEKIKQAKSDKNCKFADKLKGQIGNISSLEQLAKILYPADSNRKDFSIDSFINNL
ncbi:hypothetical protein M0P65_02200 [Candidatus Gracilibacteria bacterium]|nr:hypothetical protein [Candidatus Gracilibacteria bacterium]